MPFRLDPAFREKPLDQQGRTGEPSPAINLIPTNERTDFHRRYEQMKRLMDFRERGEGKAQGSYTEQFRLALEQWLAAISGTNWYYATVTFTYRMARKKVVTVTMRAPTIFHRPERGHGMKGFVLRGVVESFNGLEPIKQTRLQEFTLDRIMVAHKTRMLPLSRILALPEPKEI